MSDQPRTFPSRPSLRHLKLEAKRRLGPGEFATLHEAQLAIAREHGLSSWAVLKKVLEDRAAQSQPADTYALDQVRWVIARFAGAGHAATRLVLRPLAMGDSWYPVRWPDGPDAVTGYGLADQAFRATTEICTLPAAGGLWSTAADLLRFARGWHGLLPAALAAEALRPQLTRPDAGAEMGLGWLVNQERGVHGHAGGGQGGASSLIVSAGGDRIHVALTNRLIPLEPVNAGVLTALS